MRKYSICLTTFSLTVLIAAILTPPRVISVSPQTPVLDVLAGKNWAYTLSFHVHNREALQKLISCESGGKNISKPDSNHRISDGILQFNRDQSNLLGSGTWAWMESLSGIKGSPIFPADAIKLADWAISHNLGSNWTCWHLMGLDRL
jgi:hypothetical protein